MGPLTQNFRLLLERNKVKKISKDAKKWNIQRIIPVFIQALNNFVEKFCDKIRLKIIFSDYNCIQKKIYISEHAQIRQKPYKMTSQNMPLFSIQIVYFFSIDPY